MSSPAFEEAGAPPGPLAEARGLVKEFDEGRVKALRGLDLIIRRGELLAVTGPSGCGKSTLLQILGALDVPDAGELIFDGRPLGRGMDLAAFRAREIGFIFQSFHLIPTLTAAENVEVPMFELGLNRKARRARAAELLESVGLGHRLGHLPSRLSGGERQRVAVARSLANTPRLLLADEPTGNLDSASAARIVDLLLEVHQRHGTAMVIVTHDPGVAARAERVVRMLDGVALPGEPPGQEGKGGRP